MQFKKAFKEQISRGELQRTYRLWKQPQVKVGGQYNIHPFGSIEVTAISTLAAAKLTNAAAKKSGFTDRTELLQVLKVDLETGGGEVLTQIDFRFLGKEAVNQPDRSPQSKEEIEALLEKLRATEQRSSRGPWAFAALQMIAKHPGRRAPELAAMIKWETAPFKANVRKLKALGLTISLDVGYKLSPRGQLVFKAASRAGDV